MSFPDAKIDAHEQDLDARLQQQQEFFSRRGALDAAVRAFRELRDWDDIQEVLGTPTTTKAAVEFDAPNDVNWAKSEPRLSRVLHAFHLEWHGIRAAAGYLPGRKLGFTSKRDLNGEELRTVLKAVEKSGATDILFHGFSANAQRLLRLLRREGPRGLRIRAVWHGNSAQFHYGYELRQFTSLIDALMGGELDGLATVKPGLETAFPQIYPQALVNCGPRLKSEPAGVGSGRVAFIPVPNDWRKNFYTNVYAAAASGQFKRIVVTADHVNEAFRHLRAKVVQAPPMNRTRMFAMIKDSRLVLNATLSECQPMVALESLAFRVPCLTGVLGLEELDAHPYGQLTQVAGVDNVNLLKAAIERLDDRLRTDPDGLSHTMADYERQVDRLAVNRLLDFIQ